MTQIDFRYKTLTAIFAAATQRGPTIGVVIFGGTPRIIAYLRQHNSHPLHSINEYKSHVFAIVFSLVGVVCIKLWEKVFSKVVNVPGNRCIKVSVNVRCRDGTSN